MYFVKAINSNGKENTYQFKEENLAYKFAGDIIQTSDCIKSIIGYKEPFSEDVVLSTITGHNEIKFNSI